MNKHIIRMSCIIVATILLNLLGSGCASAPATSGGYEAAFAMGSKGQYAPARKWIESAELHIEATDPIKQASTARKLVQAEGGFVEHAHMDKDLARVSFRVPLPKVNATLDMLSSLGRETYRDFSAHDVTEKHSGLNAELLQKEKALKRLYDLLPTVTDPKRVLQLETQIASLEKDIQTLRASLSRTNMQVAYARLDFTIKRSRIPGPLTIAGRTLSTVVKSLFFLN